MRRQWGATAPPANAVGHASRRQEMSRHGNVRVVHFAPASAPDARPLPHRGQSMRYVGRHRAPRPLYLRRPVVAGVVGVVVLGGPALAATKGFSNDPSGVRAANQSTAPTSSPAPTGPVTVVIPTD